MSVRIVFVIPPTCRNEQECDSTTQEAYTIATSKGIDTHWIHANDPNTAKYETAKTDFIIFQDMSGDFYKRVLQSKSVILSPLCLLQCLNESKAIPQFDTPLVSLAMENCIVVCSCLPKETKRDLKAKVQSMAAVFCTQLVSDTTYLITDSVTSEKYHTAAAAGMKIMTVDFIDALWEASKTRIVHSSNEEFQKYKCPAFLNLNVCSTGFAKNETHIQRLVEQHGGKFSAAMDVNSTDVLVCKSPASTSSAKYKSAVKKQIKCVTEGWIVDSAELGVALPNVKDYAVKAATSTPTKRDGFDAPNISQMSMIIKPASQISETMQIVEETINASYMPSGEKQSMQSDEYDEVIDRIDMKKVQACGSFLDKCVIYVAGFKHEQHEKLMKIINYSGAITCFALNNQITHAILGGLNCPEFKEVKSNRYPCGIVNVNWLVDCIKAQMPVDVDKYLLVVAKQIAENQGIGNTSQCRKGLSFLKVDTTLVQKDQAVARMQQPETSTRGNEADQRHYTDQQYTGMQQLDSVDDALAAFTMNPVNPQSEALASSKCPETSNASSPSISITMEETVAAIFQHIRFMIAGFASEEEANIAEYVKSLSGTILSTHSREVPDYVVLPVVGCNLRLEANGAKVVNHLWIADCEEQGQLVDELQYYHAPLTVTSRVLEGTVVTLSGFSTSEKQFLGDLVGQLGGLHQDRMSKNTVPAKEILATTHLVLAEPTGKKYEGALKWGLPMVSKEWLLQCAEQVRKLPEQEFNIAENKENQSSVSTGQTLITSNQRKFDTTMDHDHQSPSKSTPHLPLQDNVQTPKCKSKSFSPVQTPIDEIMAGVRKLSGYGIDTSTEGILRTPSSKPLETYSQMTPVNEIMARVRKMCGDVDTATGGSPHTPGCEPLDDSMPTPDSPYGAVFQDPPPPELRKKWKRWLDSIPEPYKSPGTPLSEIRRQFWKTYYDKHAKTANLNSIQKDLRTEFSPPKTNLNENTQMSVDDGYNENTTNLVLEKLDELDALMMTGNDRTRRQSVMKIEKNVVVKPDRDTQPMSVGWDEDMVIPVNQPSKPKIFMISGVDVDERGALAEKLENIGATVSALSNFDPLSTHLLCDKLNRNEKLLAAMAGGLWILHISYATDSAAAGKLLDEEDYEFGSPNGIHKFKLDKDSQLKASAARFWRQEIRRRGYGAFHDIRAIVLANKKMPMVRVLQAGGAIVVDASPPFEENLNATHCFLEVKTLDVKPYIPLARQGILCISTLYVHDFLQRTKEDINDFIIAGLQKYY